MGWKNGFLKIREDSVPIKLAKTEDAGEKEDGPREGWSKCLSKRSTDLSHVSHYLAASRVPKPSRAAALAYSL